MKPLAFLLANLLSASACFAQGLIHNVSRPLMPSDIDAMARQVDSHNLPATEEQQKTLTAMGAIGIDQTYFNPLWEAGEITLTDGKPLAVPALRLNMLGQVVELPEPQRPGSVRRYTPAEVTAFKCSGHRFETHDFRGNTGAGKNFLEPLNEGQLRLLLLHEARLIPAVRNEALAIETKPAYYERAIRLFSLAASQVAAQEMGLTKRQVLRLMADQNKTIEIYATAQHLDYTVLEDVLKMIEFYNKQSN